MTLQLEEEDLTTPEFLFREPSKFVLVEIPFCDSNEHLVKRFLEKLKDFISSMSRTETPTKLVKFTRVFARAKKTTLGKQNEM